MWLVLHDGLWSNFQRAIDICCGSECCKCKVEVEKSRHLLRGGCKDAAVWYKLLLAGKFFLFMNLDWDSWLLTHLSNQKMVEEYLWCLTFGVCYWKLWS